MLLELRIQNMALIDSLELKFSGNENSLAVFTGETGAGKSIILQAINLLAGGRGASSWIRSDSDQAVVEALFEIDNAQEELMLLLRDNALDFDGSCIIRRVFARDGRSRFYINDRLVTARLAGEVTENLVNIASQHDHQQLLVQRRHLDFLDTYGDLWRQRSDFETLYERWRKLLARKQDLLDKEKDKEQRQDFLTFQVREIREAAISLDEDLELEQERVRLKSSTSLTELAGQCLEIMQSNILEHLAAIRKKMEQVASIDESAGELAERLQSSCYEIEDLALSLEAYLNKIPSDPYRLEQINERMSLLKQLLRKYGPTLEEVVEFGKKAEEELASLESMEKELADLNRQVEGLFTEIRQKAGELSSARKKAAEKLCEAMHKELGSLSFTKAVFEVAFNEPKSPDASSVNSSGIDHVEFLFSANPGEPPKPLVKVASGGELSRLMLAMKCILANRDRIHTVIFDEVDAGIGGKAAEAVSRKIAELAGHHQVLCITHLPQIAAAANEHFMVEKDVLKGRTRTSISTLAKEQRIMELARMLGGESLTQQTVAYARELVETNPVHAKR